MKFLKYGFLDQDWSSVSGSKWWYFWRQKSYGWTFIKKTTEAPDVLQQLPGMSWRCPDDTRDSSPWLRPTPSASNIAIDSEPQQNATNMDIIIWLVVYLPFWKIWVRQLGWWNSQYCRWKHEFHVPNHQPVVDKPRNRKSWMMENKYGPIDGMSGEILKRGETGPSDCLIKIPIGSMYGIYIC